jgi:dTDP-4-amino-4,6-dideoxygalactose transaminase
MTQSIPLVDLKAQHAEVADEIKADFDRVCQDTSFILGRDVADFETAFAKLCGVAHCIGVGNGTDALEMMVRALGLGPDDEVLVPANTFIATALGVMRAGARPVLVDCDDFHLMDPAKVEERMTSHTRALLPVHLFGQIADMEALEEIARERELFLLEDAAQSQGARRNGKAFFGRCAATSFYPGKNLGAYGDGGAVFTDDDGIAAKVRRLRNWGSDKKYYHPEIGFNSRLDTVQAVVLAAKLKRLQAWNEARRRIASRYDALLAGLDAVETPKVLPGNEHVWHLYVVRVPRRDDVLARLNAEGIGAGIHYPTPLHLHGALKDLGYKPGDFPVAERAAGEILSLPMYPHLTEEQQGRVVEGLRRAVG